MQTDYLFNGLKGYAQLKRFSYIFSMCIDEANKRYKILQFYEEYSLKATKDAFGVSRRTIYRWKAKLKENQGSISSLNPKSTKPKNLRTPTTPKAIVDEIKKLREKYPNIGKAKLCVMLQDWCKENNLQIPSESTIGRIIARDKDKMRFTPYRIDRNGKRKPIKRKFKIRKPKNLTSQAMHLWAVDTIQKVSDGIRRYVMTMIDPNTRIAFAVALPTKHSKHTRKALEALIDGVMGNITIEAKAKSFAILSDNGSEFMKEFHRKFASQPQFATFDALIKERGLTHYWTYPRSPKMNAHNERFNRTIQEQFIDFYEDLLYIDIDLFNQKMAD